MAAGQTIIAIALGAGFIASGVWFFREDRTGRLIDQFFDIYGDVPNLPEGVADREAHGGDGGTAAGHGEGLLALHPGCGTSE